jgi:hypothetical protein
MKHDNSLKFKVIKCQKRIFYSGQGWGLLFCSLSFFANPIFDYFQAILLTFLSWVAVSVANFLNDAST